MNDRLVFLLAMRANFALSQFIICGPVVFSLQHKQDLGVLLICEFTKKINAVYGQNQDFSKSNGFMEQNVDFVMTTLSRDGSETTS